MINGEKYKDRILEVASNHKVFGLDTKTNKIDNCSSINCQDCLFYTFGTISEHDVNRIKWLLSEYKEPIKLTRLEYELLKFWNSKKYNYIARDSNGMVYVYHEKPSKKAEVWGSIYKHHVVEEFDKSFQFVQWEDSEPTAIEDVLGNCEVIDDDL